MEDSKKEFHLWSAIGYFFLSWVPFVLIILVQIVAAAIVFVFLVGLLMVPKLILTGDWSGLEMTFSHIYDIYEKNITNVSLLYQVIALAIFGLWYYLVWGSKSKQSPFKIVTGKSIAAIVVLGVSLEFVTSSILAIVEIYFPNLMKAYEQLMEEAGLNEISIFMALATIIMAPIVEELVFRGVTMKFAMKINGSFWLANILQAFLFGLAHMNIVQGAYAFCLGLAMGWIIKKYNTLYASILLHAVFNFSGTILTTLVSFIPYANTLLANLLMIVIFGICTLVGIQMVKNDRIEI